MGSIESKELHNFSKAIIGKIPDFVTLKPFRVVIKTFAKKAAKSLFLNLILVFHN